MIEVILIDSYGDIGIYDATLKNARTILQCYEEYGEYSEETDPTMYTSSSIHAIIRFVSSKVVGANSDSDIDRVTIEYIKPIFT